MTGSGTQPKSVWRKIGRNCKTGKPDSVCVLDDALARQVARTLQLRITGTLGVLIDAKRAGIIPTVRPFLDQLQSLGFRLAGHTRAAVLKLAA